MSETSPAEDIFFAALQRATPAEQSAYLDEACAGQPALRAEVERLLAAHTRAGGFLESGADGHVGRPDADRQSVTTDLPNPNLGSVVAKKYKLLQQIGEGGMGSVWMADQTEPIKRRVAVKLIRVERGQSRTVLSRFEAERQAIALMDHPHIAKLLDAGTAETGLPFFVMELVKGVPLNEYCDSNRLCIPDRLQLFMQVCSAVQHAHQKGIIHRDLKPSNILVESYDGKPVPKVIDFGLAKATSGLQLTEHTLFTGFGNVMGTPQYMAPEQATFNAMDVDTRADVYSLGVILYELLTGTTPLTRDTIKKVALDEILKLIREQEAPTPSSRLSTSDGKPSVAANRQTEQAKLGRFVRGELDWIVMKALNKERDRRYETANGFAKDVERFLNHEPVQAGPPSARYTLKKFVRRNRPQVIASGLLLFVLLAGIVGTTFGLIQTARQRNRAIAAEEETSAVLLDLRGEQERTKSALIAETKARGRARTALNAMTDDVIEKLFARQQELGDDEKAFLRRVLTYYEEYAREQGNTEDARAIAAEGQRRVAKVRETLGEKREAAECYRVAIRAYQILTTDFPAKSEYRRELVACRINLGHLLKALGSTADAEGEYRSALVLAEKLADELPAEPFHSRVLALTHKHLGSLLDDMNHRAEAAKMYERAIAMHLKLAEQHPRNTQYQQDLADCHNGLAVLWSGLGHREDAEEQFRLAFAIRKKLVADHPKSLEYRRALGDSHFNLGILLERQGSYEKSQEHHRLAIAIKQQLAAEHPAVPSYRAELGRAHKTLASALASTKNDTEAEKHYRLSLDIAQELVADFADVIAYSRDVAAASAGLGDLFQLRGRMAKAEEHYRRRTDCGRKVGSGSPRVAHFSSRAGH